MSHNRAFHLRRTHCHSEGCRTVLSCSCYPPLTLTRQLCRAKASALLLRPRSTRASSRPRSDSTHHWRFVYVYRDVAQPVAPCGLCRQVIREFCALEMPILLVPAEHNSKHIEDILETTVEKLL